MMELNTKYGLIKVYAQTIDEEVIPQIIQMANSPLGENANIRIMPDAHAGAGCVIGTTMKITDKVCPNLVGVDIGCGVSLVKTNIKFEDRLLELDSVIRDNIPFGMLVHPTYQEYSKFKKMLCWDELKNEVKEKAMCSLGTLGGGNHFIEAYRDGFLSVHSGSRNIGLKVAQHYQVLAEKRCKEKQQELMKTALQNIEPQLREQYIQEHKVTIAKDLCYLEGEDMLHYLHDIEILQSFASANRQAMLTSIVAHIGGKIVEQINSIHNYIDTSTMILRKGAISAKKDEKLVIPMNMRDGLLVCKGKGNDDWNNSAPHGAGRLYSRSKAKEIFSISEYEKAMNGVFSTCINKETIDEAPFVYKDYEEIMECIEPTVEIQERLVPIFNFKAN